MGNETIIGAKLKQARLDKKLSLDELQQMTKIQKRYLEAIEQGNFDALPGDYYARAFIRQYAAAIEENGDHLVAVYEGRATLGDEAPVKPRPQVEEVSSSRKEIYQDETIFSKIYHFLPGIILGLIAVTILVIVGYVTIQDYKAEPIIAPKEMAATMSTETKEEKSTEQTVETTTSSAEPVKANVAVAHPSTEQINVEVTEAKKPVELTLSAKNAPSWFGVDVNAETIFQQTLAEKETETVTLAEDVKAVTITVGQAANAIVKINDEEITLSKATVVEPMKKTINIRIA